MNDIVDMKGKPLLDGIKAKAEATRKRAEGKHNFYVKARINGAIIEELKKALLTSSICNDDGEALIPWTVDLIEELISGIVDPGPRNKKRDT